ncbi:MAG: hypothetical protein Q7R79_01400 [bacterium]|nr:hypothetical protein [bacterium]
MNISLHPLALKALPFIAACAFSSSLSVSLSIIAAKNESVPPFIGHISLLFLLAAVCIKVAVAVHISKEDGMGVGIINWVCMSAAKYSAFVLGFAPLLFAAAR